MLDSLEVETLEHERQLALQSRQRVQEPRGPKEPCNAYSSRHAGALQLTGRISRRCRRSAAGDDSTAGAKTLARPRPGTSRDEEQGWGICCESGSGPGEVLLEWTLRLTATELLAPSRPTPRRLCWRVSTGSRRWAPSICRAPDVNKRYQSLAHAHPQPLNNKIWADTIIPTYCSRKITTTINLLSLAILTTVQSFSFELELFFFSLSRKPLNVFWSLYNSTQRI
jgi:hypothetical protein